MRRGWAIVAAIIVTLPVVGIGIGAYNAGIDEGIRRGAEAGQAVEVVNGRYGYGHGFFPIGFLLFPLFLEWLRVPRGRRWVDIGCGTGALCAAIVERCDPSSVVGVEPSTGFLDTARAALGDRVAFVQGSASDVPLEAGAADYLPAPFERAQLDWIREAQLASSTAAAR